MCSRQGKREAGKRRARSLTQIYLEAGGIALPNRSTFPLGLRTGKWKVVGVGLGRLHLHLGVAPPTRSFQGINILHQPPLLLILSRLGTFISTRRAASTRFTTPGRRNRRRRCRLPRINFYMLSLNSVYSSRVVSRQLSGSFLWPPRLTRRGLGRETPTANTTQKYVDLFTSVRSCVLLDESQGGIS